MTISHHLDVLCSHTGRLDMDDVWVFEHSVECSVSAEFAWAFWTNVSNWALDADIDSVQIHGPFAAGVRGVTQSKSSGCIEWRIAEAQHGRAVLEFPAPGAMARFVWTVEDAGGRARLTQRASISGEQASQYLDSICPALEAG